MKKSFSTIKFNWLALIALYGLLSFSACSQATKPFSINESPLPAPTDPVNDFAGVLDEATKQTLNQRIKDFKARTNPQVVLAVAIVKTTGDRDIFDYSIAVARGWKIGTKDDDNPSALLFIAIDDHKYFTQVSRNLEDELPDGVVGSLQRQFLVPAFKQANYGKGISDTIDAYMHTIESKGNGQQPINAGTTTQDRPVRSSSGGGCSILTCLIILFVLMLIIFSRFGRSGRNNRGGWGGGGFGGGSALPWIVGGILGGMGGNGGGGSSGGGSSGGSDWGGFGGGGDFGGGGAGGSW
jgi:uncharacterized protein